MPFRRLLDPGDWIATKLQIDPAALTLSFRYRPEPGEIKLRFYVGGFVLLAAAVAGYFLRDEGVALFVIGGFAFLALLNIFYGLLQCRFSMAWTISSGEVTMEKATLLGRRNWREPLAAYRGVLLREDELTSRGVDSGPDVDRYYIVELHHADPARTLPLYVRAAGPAPREIQEAFAVRFRLPALESDISGVQASAPPAPVPDPGPPPSRLKLSQYSAVTLITFESGWLGKFLPKLFWLLFPVLAGYIVYQIDPQFGLYAAGAAAVLVVVILLIGWLTNRGRQPRGLCLDAHKLWLGSPDTPPNFSVPLSAIERIRVDRGTSHSSRGSRPSRRLIVEAGSQRLEYHVGPFAGKKLDWIRRYLLHRLA